MSYQKDGPKSVFTDPSHQNTTILQTITLVQSSNPNVQENVTVANARQNRGNAPNKGKNHQESESQANAISKLPDDQMTDKGIQRDMQEQVTNFMSKTNKKCVKLDSHNSPIVSKDNVVNQSSVKANQRPASNANEQNNQIRNSIKLPMTTHNQMFM